MLAKSFRFQIFVTTSVPHVPQPPNSGHPFLRCFNLSCVGILYPFGWKVNKKHQALLTSTFVEPTIHQVLRETTTNITLPEDCGVSQDLPVLAFHSSHCWPVHIRSSIEILDWMISHFGFRFQRTKTAEFLVWAKNHLSSVLQKGSILNFTFHCSWVGSR